MPPMWYTSQGHRERQCLSEAQGSGKRSVEEQRVSQILQTLKRQRTFIMASAPEKWKHFERLVTAIHQAADRGAEVRWNDIISGRQFDVTIRFHRGLYDYLTVIECKDYERPVSVEKVEAFITKSADVQAHHAVMASTSGFQEGARDVARRHNMTLIHVSDSSNVDLSLFSARWTGMTDALHIKRIELEYRDGERKPLPEEANAMTYYVKHVSLQFGTEQTTLESLLQHHSPRFLGREMDTYQDHTIDCPLGTCVTGPDDDEIPLGPLASVHVRAGISEARTLTSPVMFDTYLLVPDVKVHNVATGEEKTFSPHDLALGVNTVFAEGTFYEQPSLGGSYYYCDRIQEDCVILYLVESFQNGQLIQAKYAAKPENANF